MNSQRTKTLINCGLATIVVLSILPGCGKNYSGESLRGEPTLVVESGPVYDESTHTFALTLRADSTAGASVTYYLSDGDNIVQENESGCFEGVAPLEIGYNVRMKVVWKDTTIVTPMTHVVGFVVPREPVERISKTDLERIFNAADRGQLDDYVVQGVRILLEDGQSSSLQDAFTYIKNKVWTTVSVTDVTYDENNYVASITIKVEKRPESESDNDEFYDEY